jgi:hypothetical protein
MNIGLRFGVASVTAVACIAAPAIATATSTAPTPSIDIPDTGWHLWLDRKAGWRQEPAFLPEDVDLSKLQPHSPTGGWSALSSPSAKTVTLPTTVEQQFWGVNGLRPYKNEYFYEQKDPTPKNGNYIGVSWWWRKIAVPKSFSRKTAILHIRAAKQVAEVYVNQKLVGYDMLAETAFDCDVSAALKPGIVNTIAIRITNPGGRLDWGDWSSTGLNKLGGIFAGHAFGGLDRGITLTAHGPVRFTDTWVLNTPSPRTVEAHAELTNSNATPENGSVIATAIDPSTGKSVGRAAVRCVLAPHGSTPVVLRLTAPNAKLWDLKHPNLYTMRFQFAGQTADNRTTTFGFRWFAPTGIGHNAVLRLNGDRIRVYSAISWGFWGLNGEWPTPALAQKEVLTAKSLGLNAINFHRNIARAECLDDADRMGLLRYTEPGGGMTLFWNKQDAEDSFQRYMQDKIVHMVRDARSHPSLMMYVIQNELNNGDYKHPLAVKVVRRIHAEDPSRVVVLKSGIDGPGEMWMMPYDDKLYVDDGTGYSGWWDTHSVGTPDAWTDENYRGPNDYVYRNTNRREIVDYGEMGGSGTADNHALMIGQIKAAGGKSYDLLDHEEIDAAYNRFLDQHGFRVSFPTTDVLYRKIGEKQYDYWAHVLECARLSDTTDYLTVSGWETTAIENHGGIVDNLRNPHGDPQIFRDALRRVMPDLQVRTSAVETGSTSTYDLYFLNESNRPVSGGIIITLQSPSGKKQVLGHYPVPAYARDVFSYPVAAGMVTPKLDEAGRYVLTAAVGDIRDTKVINVVKLDARPIDQVALASASPQLNYDLTAIGQPTVPFAPGGKYAVAICVPAPKGTQPAEFPAGLIDQVRAGMGLLILADQESDITSYAKLLDRAGAFHFGGLVGASFAPWMGSWYIVRHHPLYAGLPQDTVMKSDYQVPVGSSNGIIATGDGVEWVTAYSRDHSRLIGAGDVVARLGKGRIVFHIVPRMNTPFQRKWLSNALAYLAPKKPEAPN